MTSQVSEKNTIWHVGRSGEVAGGMTQVVNAYLDWDFEKIDVKVICSRDGTSGIKAVWLYLVALIKILTLRFSHKSPTVVVHLSQGGSFIREGSLLYLARLRGFGTVAQLHGSRFAEYSSRNRIWVKAVLNAARKVHVLSEETRNIVLTMVSADRVLYLPNAVPVGKPKKKEKLIVFGGSVCHRKGVDVLVQAWTLLQERQPSSSDWKLVIAGPVIEKELVPRALRNAEFVGSIHHTELMDLLDRASIAVLPSRDEAMPMFILEALARRCCVVSTNVGGIPKLLDRQRGMLIEAGSVSSLSEAFCKCFDTMFRKRLAENGHVSFKKEFSASAIFPVLEDMWLDVGSDPIPGGEVKPMKKVLMVASAGGHLMQLMRLRKAFEGNEVSLMTTDRNYRQSLGENIFIVQDANQWDRLALKKMFLQVTWVVLRTRPHVIVSTGAAPGFAAILFGRLIGAKTIWIDSIANADNMSKSGEKVGKWAHIWLTQWEHLARPDGPQFWGAVL